MASWCAIRIVLDRPSVELINQLTQRFLEIDYDFPKDCLKYDDWFDYREPIQGGDFIGPVLEEFGLNGFYALVPKSAYDCANADLTQYAVHFGKKPQASDEIIEARRLSTMVDRLEGESLEVIEALGLHEDTPHAEVLAHVRSLVAEHRAERSVTRAGLDDLLARVEQGARAVERDKVVAWLRTAPCDSPGHDPRWCQDCQVRERAADAIDCGVHRK